MMPATAKKSGNFDRVKKEYKALVGGSRDLVDFQVTPPLGSSIGLEQIDLGRLLPIDKTSPNEKGRCITFGLQNAPHE